MTSTADNGIAARRRVAKGPKRPQYLEHAEFDKMMMMFTALMGEVSALRDRLDTHEALGDRGEDVTRAAVESYRLDKAEQAMRSQMRDQMMNRVFRILLEDLEVARAALSTRELEEVLVADGTELPADQRTTHAPADPS